jgi:hypothetical protein
MTYLSREGLQKISQELKIIRHRLDHIDTIILDEQLRKRKEDEVENDKVHEATNSNED